MSVRAVSHPPKHVLNEMRQQLELATSKCGTLRQQLDIVKDKVKHSSSNTSLEIVNKTVPKVAVNDQLRNKRYDLKTKKERIEMPPAVEQNISDPSSSEFGQDIDYYLKRIEDMEDDGISTSVYSATSRAFDKILSDDDDLSDLPQPVLKPAKRKQSGTKMQRNRKEQLNNEIIKPQNNKRLNVIKTQIPVAKSKKNVSKPKALKKNTVSKSNLQNNKKNPKNDIVEFMKNAAKNEKDFKKDPTKVAASKKQIEILRKIPFLVPKNKPIAVKKSESSLSNPAKRVFNRKEDKHPEPKSIVKSNVARYNRQSSFQRQPISVDKNEGGAVKDLKLNNVKTKVETVVKKVGDVKAQVKEKDRNPFPPNAKGCNKVTKTEVVKNSIKPEIIRSEILPNKVGVVPAQFRGVKIQNYQLKTEAISKVAGKETYPKINMVCNGILKDPIKRDPVKAVAKPPAVVKEIVLKPPRCEQKIPKVITRAVCIMKQENVRESNRPAVLAMDYLANVSKDKIYKKTHCGELFDSGKNDCSVVPKSVMKNSNAPKSNGVLQHWQFNVPVEGDKEVKCAIPFIVGQSTSKSYHIGLNVQKTLSLFKLTPSTETAKRASSGKPENSAFALFSAVGGAGRRASCQSCFHKIDSEDEDRIPDEPWAVPQNGAWANKRRPCTCLPKKLMSFQDVLVKLFQKENKSISKCQNYIENKLQTNEETVDKPGESFEGSAKLPGTYNRQNSSFVFTKLLRNIRNLQEEFVQ